MKEAEELFEKYKAGLCTSEEKQLLQKWFHHLAEDEPSALTEQDLLTAMLTFENDIQGKILPGHTYKLWPGIAIVAAAVAIIISGVFFFKMPHHSDPISSYANDVRPGKNAATLTLANGKKIVLTDALNGELARQAGVVISKTKNGELVYEIKDTDTDPNQINTLSTARGETYALRLPDGSMAFLNAASSLTYAVSLNENGIRRVKLRGEGYFEVFKDKAHPFIVETQGQKIEVLGTHFNIKNYADEPLTKTTLLEGSVKVSSVTGGQKILQPGQQAALTPSGALSISDVDTELAIAWKNNKFLFESQQIKDIMLMVSRWYDVEVIYTEPVPDDRFSGTVSRFDNVSQVLRILESSGGVHFKIEGRKIYVSR